MQHITTINAASAIKYTHCIQQGQIHGKSLYGTKRRIWLNLSVSEKGQNPYCGKK